MFFIVILPRGRKREKRKKKLTKKEEMYLTGTRAMNINMTHGGIGSFDAFRA